MRHFLGLPLAIVLCSALFGLFGSPPFAGGSGDAGGEQEMSQKVIFHEWDHVEKAWNQYPARICGPWKEVRGKPPELVEGESVAAFEDENSATRWEHVPYKWRNLEVNYGTENEPSWKTVDGVRARDSVTNGRVRRCYEIVADGQPAAGATAGVDSIPPPPSAVKPGEKIAGAGAPAATASPTEETSDEDDLPEPPGRPTRAQRRAEAAAARAREAASA